MPVPRYVPLRVLEVIEETADARSFVLEVPEAERDAFTYRAGQYCTFRVPVEDADHLRCYSMSSAPDVDEPMRTTVKRVPGGAVSNWLNDHVRPGDILHASPPTGRFCLDPDDTAPIVAFAGGSGITPVLSIIKSALATTARPIRLLYANRDPDSVILGAELEALAAARPDRLTLAHHHDHRAGYLTPADVADFLGSDPDVTVYLCGPTPFMDLVELALAERGHDPARLHSERFVLSETAAAPGDDDPGSGDRAAAAGPVAITIALGGATRTLEHHEGETVLETARRGGLNPPFSCQSGHCATCMAELRDGEVQMRVNDALTADEVADGWILTCQSVPTTDAVTVAYPD